MKLVELATTASLLGIISAACATLVHSQTRLLRDTAERAATSESLRTAGGILTAEVRTVARSDLRAVSRDSLALRVMRGWAVVRTRDRDRYILRYEGLRAPDAEKDSILLVGEEQAGTFVVAAGEPLAIRTELPLPPGSVILFFESGAYHIATNALRYRRGLGGRQPITDELIDHRASRFGLEAGSRLLLLHLRGRNVPGRSPAVANTRIRLLNQAP